MFDVTIGTRVLHVEDQGFHGDIVVTNWPAEWPTFGDEPGLESGWNSLDDLIREATANEAGA